MAYVNNCPPAGPPEPAFKYFTEDEIFSPEPYDINFAYPLHPATLESDRLALVPFVPAVHGAAYWAALAGRTAALFRWFPFAAATRAEALSFFAHCQRAPGALALAAHDKTRPDPAHPDWPGALAGTIALWGTSPANLHTELAHVLVLPDFQRTHVARGMVGLALRYALELPGAPVRPGLGFRRVLWTAHPENARSGALARRMGFKDEGVARWLWVLPEGAESGMPSRAGDPAAEKPGRHSVVLSLCWDDWEGGAREHVEAMINQ
ncbi:acyl-CoA N-acyltransferase [Epithele typhae]|uniref:acyl-CoA N-acyltransferase n=1 Tax=Epithele typhae TaxID=378194 RepID=UPI002007657A|nr:acyl-CoA N-acyltransferase [Epithele typhae]KAH9940047.1 acyl-CoA N-acyltransferase [Epithele typhae]